MIENDLVPKMKANVHNANRIIKFTLICIFILNFIFGTIIVTFMIVNAQQTKDVATQLHKQTQEYVKCVAKTLIIPIADRHENDIELCTNQADNNTKEAQNNGL